MTRGEIVLIVVFVMLIAPVFKYLFFFLFNENANDALAQECLILRLPAYLVIWCLHTVVREQDTGWAEKKIEQYF